MMMKINIVLVSALIAVTVSTAQAEEVAVTAALVPPVAASGAGAADPASTSFFGDGAWGTGIAYLWNSQPVISNASVVNNTVRADSIQQSYPELLLNRHWYLTNKDGSDACKKGHWSAGACVGFFVAVGVGNSNATTPLVDMLGAGFMLGFGAVDGKPSAQLRQHNIGIGWGRRFGVKQLGDGIVNNTALPTGETQVRTTTIDMPVLFLMYSYTLSGN